MLGVETSPTLSNAGVLTREDLPGAGPQISFDLALGDELAPNGQYIDFDTQGYATYLRSKSSDTTGNYIDTEHVDAARLTFKPDSQFRIHKGSYDPTTKEMTAYISTRRPEDRATRTVFNVSEFFVRGQLGEKIPKDYRNYRRPMVAVWLTNLGGHWLGLP